MKQLQAIIPIYIDNIGNAVQLYFNDFTTTNYIGLLHQKNRPQPINRHHRGQETNQKILEHNQKSSYLF